MTENISISHSALEQIFTDTVEAGEIEAAGLLIGRLANGRIHITRAIPTSRGTSAYVRIFAEEIARATEELNLGEQISWKFEKECNKTVPFTQLPL